MQNSNYNEEINCDSSPLLKDLCTQFIAYLTHWCQTRRKFVTHSRTPHRHSSSFTNTLLKNFHTRQQVGQIRINALDPKLSIWQDAKQSYGMRPETAWARDELQQGKKVHLAVRRVALKKLIEADYDQLEQELRRNGCGFMPTQP